MSLNLIGDMLWATSHRYGLAELVEKRGWRLLNAYREMPDAQTVRADLERLAGPGRNRVSWVNEDGEELCHA
jgi:hypothetical protein